MAMKKLGIFAAIAALLWPTVVSPQATESFSAYVNGLTASTTIGGSDKFYILQGGASKSITASNMQVGGSNVLLAGAVCNGSTDDSSAINAALSGGATLVILPPQGCRAASTITVPAGVSLHGTAMFPGNPVAGSAIVCDLSVTPCVQVLGGAGGAGNGTSSISNLAITRASGSIPTSSQGLLIKGGYNVTIDNVMVYRSYDCWTFQAVASGNGISAKVNNLFSAACSNDHVVVNGWPELYVIGGRLGTNGVGDISGDAFIKITGGGSGIGGPNTVNFSGVQFNQGNSTSPTHWLEFSNITGGGTSAVVYSFANNYIEGSMSDLIFSDSGVSIIDRMLVADNIFAASGSSFWNINSATQLSRVHVSNNIILNSGGTFDLPSTQHSDVQVTGNYIQSESTINGAASSVLRFNGNNYAGNVTINNTTSGSWGGLDVGGLFVSGSPTSNLSGAPGKVSLDFPGYSFSYTPTVTWGGGNTGWSCTCAGVYQVINNRVDVKFSVTITAKGSSTGLFRLGLPFTLPNSGTQSDSGLVVSASGMSGLTGPLMVNPQLNNANATLNEQGASNVTQMTDGVFTSSSVLVGSVSYFLN